MRENPAIGSKMATSSSSPSPSSPRKLLRADLKPKPGPGRVATPLNSASSSSTTNVPPSEKRTRDQPNLSDCHCCGRRINHTNPKDRLQPMDSIWRIVLLCRRCRKKFASGQTCPYCFKETVKSGHLFKCSVCQREIHQLCVDDYKNCAPWCYLGVDSGSRVCVDCWIPKSLKNSIGICGGGVNRSVCELEKEGVNIPAKGKDHALMDSTEAKNSMNKKDMNVRKGGISEWRDEGKVMEDADLAVRLHRAINSSPRISRGKCSVKSCSDTVKSGDSNGLSCRKSGLGEYQSESQSANSSENERNNWANENGLCSDVYGSVFAPITYKRDRKRKTWNIINENAMVTEFGSNCLEQVKFILQSGDDRTGSAVKSDDGIWEILICVNSDQNSSCINIDRFGPQPIVYKRARFSRKVFQENAMAIWSSCENQRVSCVHQNHQPDSIKPELHSVDTGTDSVGQCNSNVIFPNDSCSSEYDRYLIKYGKRVKGSKSCPHQPHYLTFLSDNPGDKRVIGSKSSQNQMYPGDFVKCDGEFTLPVGNNNENSDTYIFKYSRRVKGSN